MLDGIRTERVAGTMYCGQRWIQIFADVKIVKSDDIDILWNSKTGSIDRTYDADGNVIVCDTQTERRRGFLTQFHAKGISVCQGVGAKKHTGRVIGDIGLLQSSPVAFQTNMLFDPGHAV